MKKQIERYNKSDTLLLISLYPKKGELYSAGTSGIASYAKNVVSSMNRKAIVLADYEKKPTSYEEANTLVSRCFHIKSPRMWFQILKALRIFSQVKTVLIQFDFAVYGGLITSSFIIPFLGLLKLLGYKVSVVSHHVVMDIRPLAGHVGISNTIVGQGKTLVYNALFHAFYILLGLVTEQVIVLEDTLKRKLSTAMPKSKIVAISHGVDTKLTSIDSNKARKRLGINQNEYVILFFGYVNWFKGADIFAKVFSDQQKMLGKKVRCIIAGGQSPTLKEKNFYQEYFSKVMNTISSSSSLEITGYVPQNMISSYFSASDLVVFPYRHYMTASGVLSLVFSYKKPFIVSKELSEMFDAEDLNAALQQSGLEKKDFVFGLTKQACLATTEKVLKNGIKAKIIRMSSLIRENRSYKHTASQYEQCLFYSPSISYAKSVALKYN